MGVNPRTSGGGGDAQPLNLADFEQFDVEDQSGVGRDGAGVAAGSVTQLGRQGEFDLVADLHCGDADVPTGDDLAGAQNEGKRLAAVYGGVEFLPRG